MTAHPAIAAVPGNGEADKADRSLLQQLLVSRFAYILEDDENPEVFDPTADGAIVLVIGFGGSWFWYDETDSTTEHDGETCLVTANGERYKLIGLDLLITSVISHTVTTPPDPEDVDEEARPSFGDAYRVPSGASGAWGSKANHIAVWVARGGGEWAYITPKVGWIVWTRGEAPDGYDVPYHYDSAQGEWLPGLGGQVHPANTVPLSAIIGCDASLMVRVENQTIYAPPGSRKTGGTATMPLGGTASNINDDDGDTTTTTSALGNLTGAAVSSRIIGQIALDAASDLIAIEVRGILGSTTSSSNAMALYYSTDGGASWTQAGAGFTLSTAAQNIIRTGAFNGVTHVAVVTEDKNWSSNTNTLADLNAYDDTIEAAVGTAYIVGDNPFGGFSGLTGKVVICEEADTFTPYTPSAGDFVFDKALAIPIRWNGTSWDSAYGAVLSAESEFTSGVVTNATGTGAYSYSNTTPPATSLVHGVDTDTITFTARPGARRLDFFYQATVAINVAGRHTFALLRDNESNAVDWTRRDIQNAEDGVICLFSIENPDTSEHEYTLATFAPSGGAVSLSRRTFKIEEIF